MSLEPDESDPLQAASAVPSRHSEPAPASICRRLAVGPAVVTAASPGGVDAVTSVAEVLVIVGSSKGEAVGGLHDATEPRAVPAVPARPRP